MDDCTPKLKPEIFNIPKYYKDLYWGAPYKLKKESKEIFHKTSGERVAYDRIVYTRKSIF